MNDENKTRAELIIELQGARAQIAAFEASVPPGAEATLRLEQGNLRRIFEAMVDGVYVVNQQHDIEYVNPVLVKDFGDYEGRKCHDYFHDLDRACPWCKNADVFAGKTVRWEWRSPKNNRIYDLIDTPLANLDGSISKLEIFRDISVLRQAEDERMEQALVGADLGTWDWNVGTGHVAVNERFAAIIGQSLDEIDPSLSTWMKLIHPDDIREAEQKLKACLEGETELTHPLISHRKYRV